MLPEVEKDDFRKGSQVNTESVVRLKQYTMVDNHIWGLICDYA